ncbi:MULTISPECIES: DUF397 domain-containing protein [Nocardiopsis]|uniref:DUF397 domain-containing protein n=1 Tax=Nocardiopsis TaxID=2013 RepID=UPI0009896B86|nr:MULTISPECIES: DUF397 domain-containing protein [Nocardiopsis]
METDAPRWFKSSHSAPETCCLEAAIGASGVRVRDSTRQDAAPIELAAPEWTALLRVVSGSRGSRVTGPSRPAR